MTIACSAALRLVKSLQNERSRRANTHVHSFESVKKKLGLTSSSEEYKQQSNMNPKIVIDEVDAGEQTVTWSTDLRPIVEIGHINRIPVSLIVSPVNVESSVDTAILDDFEAAKDSNDQPAAVGEVASMQATDGVTTVLTEDKCDERIPAADCGSVNCETKEIVFDTGVHQTSGIGSTETISKSKKKRLKAKKRAANILDSSECGTETALNHTSAPTDESEIASSSRMADNLTASHEPLNDIIIDPPDSTSSGDSLPPLVTVSEPFMRSAEVAEERSAVNLEKAEQQRDQDLHLMSISASTVPSSGSAKIASSLDLISAAVSANAGISGLANLSAPIIDNIAATIVAEVFSLPVSKTMRKKLNARKRSAELAESLTGGNAKKAKNLEDDGHVVHVESKIDSVAIAPAFNGAATIVEATISDEKSSESNICAAPVVLNVTTQIPDDASAIASRIVATPVPSVTAAAIAVTTTTPAAATGVSKGVRKRLKARVKAEEALALNPEGAELTALLKAALINKAAQANHAKQKLETLTAKTTKYLPPSMRIESLPQQTPLLDAPSVSVSASASTATHRPLSKYGPRPANPDPYVRSSSCSPTETPKSFNKYSHSMQTTTHTSATAYKIPQQYQMYNDPPGQAQSNQQASSAASWGVSLSRASQPKMDPSNYGNSDRQSQLSASYGNQVHSHGQVHALDQNSYQPIQRSYQGSHYPLSSSGLSNYSDANINNQLRSAEPVPSANYQQQQYAQYAPSMTNGHIYSPNVLSTAHQYSPSLSGNQYAPAVGASLQQYAQPNATIQQYNPTASASVYAIQYGPSSPASSYSQPLQQHSYQQQQRSYQDQATNQPQHLLAHSEYSIASSSPGSSHVNGAQTSYGLGTAYSYVSPSLLGIQNHVQNQAQQDNGGNTANYLPPTNSMKAGYQRSAS